MSLRMFLGGAMVAALMGCQTSDVFRPRGSYPPDPWVKGYSKAQDCLGGEKLAAIKFDLPAYPRRAFRSGRQGWTIIRLDVTETGQTENVRIERSVPDRFFGDPSRRAVMKWQFAPPPDGALNHCRVLIRYQFGKVSLGG